MIRGWRRKRKRTTGGIERRSVRNMRGRPVDHERKTGGSPTRPYERGAGWGYWVWGGGLARVGRGRSRGDG